MGSNSNKAMLSAQETLSVQEALAQCDALKRAPNAEQIPLNQALGRVLYESIVAKQDSPLWNQSAMDGYALFDDLPSKQQVIETIPAGYVGHKIVQEGTCARVMTGSRLPVGASRVIIQENVVREGDTIQLTQRCNRWANVRIAGEEIQREMELLHANQSLTPSHLALCAAQGISMVTVTRKPKIILLITGDELKPPEAILNGAEIYESNSILLQTMIEEDGGEVIALYRVGDDQKVADHAPQGEN